MGDPDDRAEGWSLSTVQRSRRITSSIERGIVLDLDAWWVTAIGYAREAEAHRVASDAICRTGPSF